MLRVWAGALAAAIALTAGAAAAKAPPLPQATGHRTVTVVARGIPTPTEFAVFAGRLFVGVVTTTEILELGEILGQVGGGPVMASPLDR